MPTLVRNRDGEVGYLDDAGNFYPNPPSPAEQAAEDVGRGEAALISAGQFAETFPDRVSAIMGSDQALGRVQEAEANMAPLREAYPITTAVSEGAAGMMIPGGMGVQTVVGGIEGAAMNPEDPLTGAAIGAGSSLFGSYLGDQVMRSVNRAMAGNVDPDQLLKSRRAARQRLRGEGIRLTATQSMGGRGIRTIESGLQSLPFVGSIVDRPLRQQQEAINNAAARVFGLKVPGNTINKAVLRLAKKNTQKKFDLVENSIPPEVLPPNVAQVVSELNLIDPKTKKLIDVTGPLEGDMVLNVRSAINDQVADLAMDSQIPAANALRLVLNELDDHIDSGIRFTRGNSAPAVLQALDEARSEWRFLTALRQGKTVSKGNVNPLSANAALKRIYPNFDVGKELPGKARQFGQLLDDIDALENLLPDSGTAGRTLAAATVTGQAAMMEPTAILLPGILAQWASSRPGEYIGSGVGRATARGGIELSDDWWDENLEETEAQQ